MTDLTIQPLDIGIGVNKMQAYLNIMQQKGYIQTINLQDGVYGEKTIAAVKQWQTYKGLAITGIIDDSTWDSIINELKVLGIVSDVPLASSSFFLSNGNQGLSTYKMQQYLNEVATLNACLRPIPVDGIYGPRTISAVSQYQYLYDLHIDGTIGLVTWDSLINMHNSLS